MVSEILESIFEGLDMHPRPRLDAIDSLMEFGNAHKSLNSISTFAADQRQVLWSLLSHLYSQLGTPHRFLESGTAYGQGHARRALLVSA